VLVRLRRPVSREQLLADPTTRHLGIVRQNFRGKRDITEEWSQLYNKIVTLNPHSKRTLSEYRPD
jgi:hypothetical protein